MEGLHLGRDWVDDHDMTSNHISFIFATSFLIFPQKLSQQDQQIVLLYHVIVHSFVVGIGIVNIHQHKINHAFTALFFFQIYWHFLQTIGLEIYENCLLASQQFPFICI